MLSRLCEEFPGVLPSRLLWELEHDPDHLVLKIIAVRRYSRAMELVAAAKSESDLPKTDLVNDVIETRLALMTEVFHEKLAAAAERQRLQEVQDGA